MAHAAAYRSDCDQQDLPLLKLPIYVAAPSSRSVDPIEGETLPLQAVVEPPFGYVVN
jgi:hypothetical protein